MEGLMGLLVPAIAGAVGGNAAGAVSQEPELARSATHLPASLAAASAARFLHVLGGAAPAAAAAGAATGAARYRSDCWSDRLGGVGGGVLLIIVGIIKSMMSR